jgi:hypothetical protein
VYRLEVMRYQIIANTSSHFGVSFVATTGVLTSPVEGKINCLISEAGILAGMVRRVLEVWRLIVGGVLTTIYKVSCKWSKTLPVECWQPHLYPGLAP